jgi:hypothetical protein
MNWNSLRSIIDFLIVLQLAAGGMLVGLGCSDTGTKWVCDAANVPMWLLPWLTGFAMVLGFVRMILKGLTSAGGLFGKETKVIAFLTVMLIYAWLAGQLVA